MLLGGCRDDVGSRRQECLKGVLLQLFLHQIQDFVDFLMSPHLPTGQHKPSHDTGQGSTLDVIRYLVAPSQDSSL